MIAVNNTHELAPWADVVYAMDRAWWNMYGTRIAAGPELWTVNQEAAKVHRLNHIVGEDGAGMPRNRNSITMGGNSGFQAVQLALHFGARRVILLGYDMQLGVKGQTHWHGDHKGLGNPLGHKMADWVRRFDRLGRELPKGIEIVNASRATAVRAFPRVPLADCLA